MPELPDPDERRKRYFEDYADRVGRHRESEHFYEQRAIDFASNARRQKHPCRHASRSRSLMHFHLCNCCKHTCQRRRRASVFQMQSRLDYSP
jgi:hypothetical protein